MIQYILAAAAAVATIIIGTTVFVLWDDIRDTLADWLRSNGLNKSSLMDALVDFDTLVGQVRCRLRVITRSAATIQIDETQYAFDQITDPAVLAELRTRGHAVRSVINLID